MPVRTDQLLDSLNRDDRSARSGFNEPYLSDDWLDRARQEIERQDHAEVLVDFSGIVKISSRQLSELIQLQLQVRNTGRRLVLENPHDQLVEIFSVTRLDRLIELRQRDQSPSPNSHSASSYSASGR